MTRSNGSFRVRHNPSLIRTATTHPWLGNSNPKPNCQVSNKVGLDRYCEKNEKENNEETQAEYKALEEADLAFRPPLLEEFEKHAARCKIISLNTD